jgi:hypothetical protein
MVFVFLPHAECAVNKKKKLSRSKFKVGGGCFSAHMYAYNIDHSAHRENFENLPACFTTYSVGVE